MFLRFAPNSGNGTDGIDGVLRISEMVRTMYLDPCC